MLNNTIKEKTGEIINIINDCNNLKNELIHFKNEYEKRIDDLSKDNEELKKNNWMLIGQIKEKNIKIKEMESIIENLKKELNASKNNIVKKNLINYLSLKKKSKTKSNNNESYSFHNIENSVDSHNFNNTLNINSKTSRTLFKPINANNLYNFEKGKKNRAIILKNLNKNKINKFSKDKAKYGLNNTFDSPLKYSDLIIDNCMNLQNSINVKNNI